MRNTENAVAVLKKLKDAGIHIIMDAFGIGYSSLSHLRSLPLDGLKIDHSLVEDILKDPEAAAIVKAIIAMAHSLKLKTIAEGVEHKDQLKFLRDHGCDEVQGYFFSKPLPMEEVKPFLNNLHKLEGIKYLST